MTFTCILTADAERVALVVQRQLAAIGVDMKVEEVTLEQLNEAAAHRNFEAVLAPIISGPTVFRPYLWWHSHGPLNREGYSSVAVDTALDSVRHATSDQDYRAGVEAFQRAILEDPPAIFLAWDERARAITNRFEVPPQPEGGDILGTLRLWRSVAAAQAHRN